MSIANKLDRLETARQDIITALYNKNIDADGHGIEHFAQDIDNISENIRLIGKTVNTNGIYIASDEGVYGYSQFTTNIHPGYIEPAVYDSIGLGYVANGQYKIGTSDTANDLYEVQANHMYFITLGYNVGNRFRAMFSTENTLELTDPTVTISGATIINLTNPVSYRYTIYTAPENGYITISKDNAGTAGIKTFVFDYLALLDEPGVPLERPLAAMMFGTTSPNSFNSNDNDE